MTEAEKQAVLDEYGTQVDAHYARFQKRDAEIQALQARVEALPEGESPERDALIAELREKLAEMNADAFPAPTPELEQLAKEQEAAQ